MILSALDQDLRSVLKTRARATDREKAAHRVQITLQGMARKFNLIGEVNIFGSFSNGCRTGSSDLDVVLMLSNIGSENVVSLLGKFAAEAEIYGFANVTKIFGASVPLVKFTDMRSQMEVDFCINNVLGIRNSKLLNTYCRYDARAQQLGRLVKDWAKKGEIVGTADGCLNSYAYMLLVIYYLQTIQPCVVPNLQLLATESVPVADGKWGVEDRWETKFVEDIEKLPDSTNTMTTGELIIGFFEYFSETFDWRTSAVCIRLAKPGSLIDKHTLTCTCSEDQWYVEDPFDLRHNLAGKCSRAGRLRILELMRAAHTVLTSTGSWSKACPEMKLDSYFMKCRVSAGLTPQALLEEFEDFNLVKLHFPKPEANLRTPAFLEFSDPQDRRRAHTRNGKYLADCQLQMNYSTQHSLAEAVQSCPFSSYEMASFKMQRQVLQARVHGQTRSGTDITESSVSSSAYQDTSMMLGHDQSSMMSYPYYSQQALMSARSSSMWERGSSQFEDHQMPSWRSMSHRSQAVQQWYQPQQQQQMYLSRTNFAQDAYADEGTRPPGHFFQQLAAAKQHQLLEQASSAKSTTASTSPWQSQSTSSSTTAGPNKVPSTSTPSQPTKLGGWLDIPFRYKLGESSSFLSKEEVEILESTKAFLKDYRSVSRKAGNRELVLHVPINDKRKVPNRTMEPLLNPSEWQQLKDFRAWFDSCRVTA